jgi:hypothetical protein
MHDGQDLKRGATGKWIKRFGVAGFLFFLIKGLAWLGIAAAASLGIATL